MEVSKKCFTCTGKSHGAPCVPATREDWEAVRRQEWLKDMCRRIKQGDEQLKHRLPVWTPHCAGFRNNHRAIADAVKPLSRLMLDFDEKGHTEDILQSLKAGSTISEKAGIVVLLVEESVRGGTHVLVELPRDMSADEAQLLMRQVTGFEPDKAVKDVARCIYMVSDDHTRYVSDMLFEIPAEQEEARPAGTAQTQGADMGKTEAGKAETGGAQEECPEQGRNNHAQEFKGIPYADIISEYWKRTGGEPQEGERNQKLHQLAANLRAICDNSESWLMDIMPRYGLGEQEMRSIVHSACKEPTKGSRIIGQITRTLEDGMEGDETAQTSGKTKQDITVNVKALPPGLKESLVGVPAGMHLPVLCAVIPLAAAYADSVEVEYCDGNRQRLGLMSIIRGEQASGKSVCKNAVDVWKRQLDEEDALARRCEEEWKERKKGRKANEKAPEDPRVLIRMVPVTVSCSTLLKRLKNSRGHTIYSFGEELDTLRKTNGAGSWSSKYDIYRLSFDAGEWGQDYNSDQADSGTVRVAYNWTLLGTNGALRKCFKQDNIENGLSSRILVAEMPDSSFAKMPRFGRRSAEDEKIIQEAVTRLRARSGFVDTPRLRKAIGRWVEEKRVEAAKDIDRVKDTYRKRAAVIGFRCGVVFHLLTGSERETKHCIDFALMIAEYTLEQQISAFGDALRSEYIKACDEGMRYGANRSVFDRLPPVFSVEDVAALKQVAVSRNSLVKIVSRWSLDGWVEKTDAKHWRKMEKEKLRS